MPKYKKGDCYEQVVIQTTPFTNDDPEVPVHEPTLRIVHGRPKLTRPPFIRYGHAWLEFRVKRVWLAYDVVMKKAALKDAYYKAGKIQRKDCFRYSPEEARRMAVEYGHYGPWEGVEGCPPIQDPEED